MSSFFFGRKEEENNNDGVQINHNSNFYDTIDEPILATLGRDLKAIGRKCVLVALPMMNGDSELKDWDLWGPLVISMILALTLGLNAQSEQTALVFSAVFVIVWVGSVVITLNAKFLGAQLSLFQIVCVLGYCLAPITVASLLTALFFKKYVYAKIILTVISFAWSLYASFRFFKGCVREERQGLVVYPLALFFFFVCWMLAVGINVQNVEDKISKIANTIPFQPTSSQNQDNTDSALSTQSTNDVNDANQMTDNNGFSN